MRNNRTKNQGPRTKENHGYSNNKPGSRFLVPGSKKTGTVFLVGAGPGDPGLLTLRGYEILKQADVVLYDALVHPVIVDFAVRAEKVFAGKTAERTCLPAGREAKQSGQDEINRQMVALAREGKKVVRLKGGDPFVFGRGGEEAEYLKQHHIPFEVIPGVSAGFAVPAFAGIPVTDRRFASAVVFVTAHENPEKEKVSVDWKKLAEIKATLVCFMGVKSLPQVARDLIQGGKASATPACVIEWGTLARQRVIEGTLENISARSLSAKIESPALTVIGEVVSLRRTLDWFGNKPLSGKRILITRATADAGPFRAMLEAEGAIVCEAPMIKIEPPRSWNTFDKVVKERLERFGWILFTSVHAVQFFFARLKELEKDTRALGKCKVAAVGESTADALRAQGIEPDILPRAFHTRELLRELQEKYFVRGMKFLWPRADIAPLELKYELEQAGAEVTDAILYNTVPDPEGKRRVAEILSEAPIDYAIFTSGSGVKNFFKGLGAKEANQIKNKAISIGPQTSQALHEFKIPILAEAKTHNLDGLIQTLKELASGNKNNFGTKNQEPGTKMEKCETEIRIPKPELRTSELASRTQEAKARIHSHAPRSPQIQRFAPRPPRKR